MFQSFEETASPDQGPARLAALRAVLAEQGLDGFIVPRADRFMGEYVAPRDERLSWLTGFTGSAGLCVVLADIAGVFIDGRYTVQVRSQVDLDHFTPVPWPATRPGTWLAETAPKAARIGIDPWLHAPGELEKLQADVAGTDIAFVEIDNPIDAIWSNQPAPPVAPLTVHPLEFAGEPQAAKCARLAEDLGGAAALITQPDSVAWLLNLRGADIARNPVPHAMAILQADASVDLFCDPGKADDTVRVHLGDTVRIQPEDALITMLAAHEGPMLLDKATCPLAALRALGPKAQPVLGEDPCLLPKARKNPAEISGMRDAHIRDGAAMVRFLAWLDRTAPGGTLTEIDVATALEGFRAEDNALRDISFDSIVGSGAHGAIVHYRVTENSNVPLTDGSLLLVDSGGQYLDGTTDITRTVPIGPAGAVEADSYTRVLQGLIAMSRARWPQGLAGRDLDALARYPLWLAGRDYDHGTGHGVGAYLSVHEGPQRLSRVSHVPLEAGMILSNEPGHYREGAYGIRLENLIVVQEAPRIEGQDDRTMLSFETLTFVPFDRRLILTELLSQQERDWIDDYHTQVAALLAPRLDAEDRAWLAQATAPL